MVLSSTVQIARNIADTPFPDTLTPDGRRSVRDKLLRAMRENVTNLGDFSAGTWAWVDMEAADDSARQARVETGEASAAMAAAPEGTGILEYRPKRAPSLPATLHVRLLDGDHLRFRGTRPEGGLVDLYRRVAGMETAFDGVVANYAFDATYGYLTPDPGDMGTGLHLSADFLLAGLRLAGDIDRVFRAMDRLGLDIRPVREEMGNENTTLFRISNLQTLGEDEERILLRVDAIFQDVAVAEDRARLRLAESDSPVLRDYFGRIYGTALHAGLLSVAEATELFHTATMGIDLGLYQPRPGRATPDQDLLFRPMVFLRRTGASETLGELDELRADAMRSFFKGLRLVVR